MKTRTATSSGGVVVVEMGVVGREEGGRGREVLGGGWGRDRRPFGGSRIHEIARGEEQLLLLGLSVRSVVERRGEVIIVLLRRLIALVTRPCLERGRGSVGEGTLARVCRDRGQLTGP